MKISKKILCIGFIALTCGLTTMTAQVTIGAASDPESGALLDLKSQVASGNNVTATKGMLYPRVELFDDDDLYPMFTAASPEYNTDAKKTAAKKAHIGLTVYNVGTNNNFVPGLYIWDGDHWVRPVTKLPDVQVTRVNSVDLQQSYTPVAVPSSGAQGDGGTEMNFGTIEIPETGSYAFCFRFYGHLPNATIPARTGIYTLSLWANSSTYSPPPSQNPNLRDIAEIDLAIIPYEKPPANSTTPPNTSYVYTYSITLGGYYNKGEKVKVKMTNYRDYEIKWTLVATPSTATTISAARTSLLWWKL